MKFLCQHHRQQYLNCPAKAKRMWYQLIVAANEAVLRGDWKEAVFFQGNAFDVSALILEADCDSYVALDRYANTALDLGYVLKASKLPLNWLIESVTTVFEKWELDESTLTIWNSISKLEKTVNDNVL